MHKVKLWLKNIGMHIIVMYNQNIENEDVWIRVFVQSLDGEDRKWFRELPTGSINGIEVLEEFLMKQWGDSKYHLYYE